jgi:hypothetical protein
MTAEKNVSQFNGWRVVAILIIMILVAIERKANMVSNLMVVLCSDKSTQPIVNVGSLY